MYLMKRSVDTITSDISKVQDKTLLICKDNDSKKMMRDVFDQYFLILETLEEKQVHLIKQICVKIENLLARTNLDPSSFHYSWILIAFLRLFHHPNISIVRWGVITFLQAGFHKDVVSQQHFLSFVCNPLLEVLNETKLYTKDLEMQNSSSSGELISNLIANFLTSCLSKLDHQMSDFLRTFVSALVNKSWVRMLIFVNYL